MDEVHPHVLNTHGLFVFMDVVVWVGPIGDGKNGGCVVVSKWC